MNKLPGHLRRGAQGENIQQAVARGYQRGSKPGMVDVRGPAGASHAIQDAVRGALAAGPHSPAALSRLLEQVLADGFPMVDVLPLFADLPRVPVQDIDDFPADLFAVPSLPVGWATAVDSVPLFDL